MSAEHQAGPVSGYPMVSPEIGAAASCQLRLCKAARKMIAERRRDGDKRGNPAASALGYVLRISRPSLNLSDQL